MGFVRPTAVPCSECNAYHTHFLRHSRITNPYINVALSTATYYPLPDTTDMQCRYRHDCGNGSSPFTSPTTRWYAYRPVYLPTCFNFKIHFRIVPTYTLGTSNDLFPLGWRPSVFISRFSHVRFILRQSYASPFAHPNNIPRTVQTALPLTMQFAAPP